MKNHHFGPLVSFPQVFEQVKGLLILELYEIVRVPHIAAWPMDLNLLCDLGQLLELLKILLF